MKLSGGRRQKEIEHWAIFRPGPRSSTSPRRDRVADHQDVVERQHLVADDLAGFMAFPGDDENIAATQLSNRGANSLAALADFDGVRRGGDDRAANLVCPLAARAIIADIHQISEVACHP